MKPGREMDALIAEKVMGWSQTPEGFYEMDSVGRMTILPKFSTDIAAAWEVVEELDNYCLEMIRETADEESGYEWQYVVVPAAVFRCDHAEYVSYHSMAHAICLAALKVAGHE